MLADKLNGHHFHCVHALEYDQPSGHNDVMTDYSFSVAPMMAGTDRHCRYFHRLMSGHARLYTEMITADATIYGDRDYLLGFDQTEHPVALQLGGSDPVKLAKAAVIGSDFGYDEINLNVGCPSDRVQSGAFGACLMRTPSLVAECISAMNSAVDVPVTVKCRIGVDDQDPSESLPKFIECVASAGCDVFIIHARKAWLDGLSPKDNRNIPPLDYPLVYALKEDNPNLNIILNGGLETLEQCKVASRELDGVMLGRAPYARPWLLSEVDEVIFGEATNTITREDIALLMHDYIAKATSNGRIKTHSITRHMIGLFHGTRGAKIWRRALSDRGASTQPDIIQHALASIQQVHSSAA